MKKKGILVITNIGALLVLDFIAIAENILSWRSITTSKIRRVLPEVWNVQRVQNLNSKCTVRPAKPPLVCH